MSLFSTGVSALNAAQQGIATTGHNIANASTPGYHRQQIIQTPAIGLNTGSGFIGQGVQVTTVSRQISQYLETQLLQVQAQSASVNSYLQQIQPLDNALGGTNSSTGSFNLSTAIQGFFAGVSAAANNPTDVPSRQSLISSANAMVTEFQALNTTFEQARVGVNTQIQDSVSQINSYATQLANINQQIILAQAGAPPGQVPNDLLDQREQLTSQLNQQVGTSTVIQSDGTASVFFGSGQTLVIGNQAFSLQTQPDATDPQTLDVNYILGNTKVPIGASNITGGSLGGLLAFRDQTLDPAQSALGRVAVSLATAFNTQHELGQDIQGNAGGAFFNIPAAVAQGNTKNVGNATITATVNNPQSLTTSDYGISFNGTYTITRLSDNTVQASGVSAAALAGAGVDIDGLHFQLSSGAATAGDTFEMQPTREAAGALSVSSRINTSTIAIAAPITTAATLGNLGTGAISPGSVNSPNDTVAITFTSATTFNVVDSTTGATLATAQPYTSGAAISFNGWTTKISGTVATGDAFQVSNGAASKTNGGNAAVIAPATIAVLPLNPNLKDKIQITFTSPTTFDVVDTTTATTLATAVTYNPTTGAAITFNGWSAKITGNPATNDTFTLGPTVSGTADNRNGLLLAQLESTNTMAGNTTSFEGGYAQLLNQVGNKGNELNVSAATQTQLVAQTTAAEQSISGVNLDEEAAKLMQYQQAYQAAGKYLQTVSELFASILAINP
ncbi:MAG TPA: flagellar hook-associated protein FlgK [Methylophilaceae bacterium]|jgi:flagellar hook-associated protein 1 FlgK